MSVQGAARGMYSRLQRLLDQQGTQIAPDGVQPVVIVGDTRELGAVTGLQYRRFSSGSVSGEAFTAGNSHGFRVFAPVVITRLWVAGTAAITTYLIWRVQAPGVGVTADGVFTVGVPFVDAPVSATDFAPVRRTASGGTALDAAGMGFFTCPPLLATVNYEGGLFLREGSTVLMQNTAAVANAFYGFDGYVADSKV